MVIRRLNLSHSTLDHHVCTPRRCSGYAPCSARNFEHIFLTFLPPVFPNADVSGDLDELTVRHNVATCLHTRNSDLGLVFLPVPFFLFATTFSVTALSSIAPLLSRKSDWKARWRTGAADVAPKQKIGVFALGKRTEVNITSKVFL